MSHLFPPCSYLSVCGHTDFASTLEEDISGSVPAQACMWHVSRFPTNNATVVAESLQQCVSKYCLPEAEHLSSPEHIHLMAFLLFIPLYVYTVTVEPTFMFKKP